MSQYNKKGAVFLLSDMITLVSSMFLIVFMLFISGVVVFLVVSDIQVNVIGRVIYSDQVYDNMMLAYIDSTYDGHKMSELLEHGVWARSTDVEVGGKTYDLKVASDEIMKKITDKTYVLKLEARDERAVLSSSGNPGIKKSEFFVQSGEVNGKIVLYGG